MSHHRHSTKIIVAYDGSDQARRALQALAWFSDSAAAVTVVTVLDGTALDANGDPIDPDPEELRQAEEMLTRAIAAVDLSVDLNVDSEVLVGDPKVAILRKAKVDDVDLIITGSRGLGLGKRLVFGSVSTALLDEAGCAVMVVK